MDAATIGHNNPPTPFEIVKGKLEELRIEAGNWLDGAEIENQDQADELGKLLDKVRKASKEADEAKEAEKKPFSDAANEVQNRYNTLTGKTKSVTGIAVIMEEGIKSALTKWLRKVAERQESERKEAERIANEAAEKARAALEASQSSDDIAQREEALAEIDKARNAAFDLSAANKAKAQAQTDGGRAIGLVTSYTPQVGNRVEALRHYFSIRPSDFDELILKFAKEDIRQKKYSIPGVIVLEEYNAR